MQIIPEYFLLSALVTILVLYIINPHPRVFIKYPNPKKEISDLYVDDKGVCYKYHRENIN
jgi:hypothetical protein